MKNKCFNCIGSGKVLKYDSYGENYICDYCHGTGLDIFLRKHNRNGYTLTEVLIAILLLVFIVLFIAFVLLAGQILFNLL